ncbi:nucleoside triphosphate pyrophosphohydrolase [Planococcus citreus]|uniref:Putative house-cleaning noncanonical NTP pyrophosphatase (MazG superfamily) n=1 Tax=Planococcus citreus TaxID=1373 RepID=A0A497YJG7_9BACL|nr:nucleoside triphosphate pyrophosphohydrolase [Planococcus citreus]RLJ91208.1 putative house-cleaning noncanonical NTP pyrophosphatase (MazG superfamily) [Planococcus citreus]
MPTYNKLVRDKIPQVIENNGLQFKARILSEEEYRTEVTKKLTEELREFEETDNPKGAVEELADILELIHAAAELNGFSFEEVEEVRVKKAEKRGGFKERIFLIEVEDE